MKNKNRIVAILLATMSLSAIASQSSFVRDAFDFIAPTVTDKDNLTNTAQYGTIVYDNTDGNFVGLDNTGSWQQLTNSSQSFKYAKLWEQESDSTAGGTSTGSSWNTRVLNQESDPYGIVTLSSNRFTLEAGTYVIRVHAPAYKPTSHRLRIYNYSDSSTEHLGTNYHIDSAVNATDIAEVSGLVTISAQKTFQVDHWIENGVTSNGLGTASGDSEVEVYTTVEIIQLQ